MSNPESFIDEVTEEVRRDKLYAAFRKYGWIGVLIVLGVVGGTAWTEWRKSSAETAAMAFGDAVMAATELQTPAERRAMGYQELPGSLAEALQQMEKSELVAEALGEHVFDYFLRNKRAEFDEYRRQVTPYELSTLLPKL